MKTAKIILELELDGENNYSAQDLIQSVNFEYLNQALNLQGLENIEVSACETKVEFSVYHSVINHAIVILKSELHEVSDLEEVSYFEGAFNVISGYAEAGTMDKQQFATYLSDFIREDGIQRATLEKVNLQVLEDLEKML